MIIYITQMYVYEGTVINFSCSTRYRQHKSLIILFILLFLYQKYTSIFVTQFFGFMQIMKLYSNYIAFIHRPLYQLLLNVLYKVYVRSCSKPFGLSNYHWYQTIFNKRYHQLKLNSRISKPTAPTSYWEVYVFLTIWTI